MPTCTDTPSESPTSTHQPAHPPWSLLSPSHGLSAKRLPPPRLYFPSTASSTAPAAAYTDLSWSGTLRCPMQRVSLSLALLLSSFLTSPSLLSPFLCSAASPLLAAAPHPAFDLPSAPNVQRSEGPWGPLSLSPLSVPSLFRRAPPLPGCQCHQWTRDFPRAEPGPGKSPQAPPHRAGRRLGTPRLPPCWAIGRRPLGLAKGGQAHGGP